MLKSSRPRRCFLAGSKDGAVDGQIRVSRARETGPPRRTRETKATPRIRRSSISQAPCRRARRIGLASNKSIRAADDSKVRQQWPPSTPSSTRRPPNWRLNWRQRISSANVATFELANTLRAQHAKECAILHFGTRQGEGSSSRRRRWTRSSPGTPRRGAIDLKDPPRR